MLWIKGSFPGARWKARRPDPYRVWLSEMMLQQTTVAAVKPYFEKFTARWPDVRALAAADEAEVMAAWAGLGYYARARNLIACARTVVGEHEGRFPDEEAALRALPGIGRYTAAAIAAIAFGRRAVAVDANVERVVSRLFAVEEPLPGARERIHALADSIVPDDGAGDFAQAMMDLGSTICTPRNPDLRPLPARPFSARRGARGGRRPIRSRRRRRPGHAGGASPTGSSMTIMSCSSAARPRGLLGGMLGLPTGPGADAATPGEGAPAWRPTGARRARSTMSSPISRSISACSARPRRDRSDAGEGATWWPVERLDEAGLPTLFARAAARGMAWRAAA